MHMGHQMNPLRVPERYNHSLSNLRRYFQEFDELEVFDNSKENPDSHFTDL